MNRSGYYEGLKSLARGLRDEYDLRTPRVLKSDMRRIYRDMGIRIDLWPRRFAQLRGAYFNDDLGPTVMVVKGLPAEPTIFTLGHELKHHLTDRESDFYYCADSNVSEAIEIGAEVFGAELIFPEDDFVECVTSLGITPGDFAPDALICLKRSTRTTLSYAGLVKRAERLGYAPRGSLAGIRWKKREEELFGEPVYKRVMRRRALRAVTRVR